MDRSGRFRTVAAVAVTVLILGAAAATAAATITGADVKDGTLTGADLKDGSIGLVDMGPSLKPSIANRVTKELPSKGFSASNGTVVNTNDGVMFGPYANGGADGGSLCTSVLNGKTLSQVGHLAFEARYTSEGDTAGIGVPYLRIFLGNDTHDAIFSPNTQPPDPDVEEGPFHTWVASAGLWRYDDDSGSGGEYGLIGAPFNEVKADHGSEVISKICITMGSTAGTDLTGLLRTWEVNQTDYAFGQ